MRYKPEHKERTRHDILSQAARLFRRRGYDGVGIDGLMAAANLTRGGFYGYFQSKADLFAAVMRGEHDFVRRMQARTATAPAALTAEALKIVGGYLDPTNRDRVGRGCHMASLSVDVARGEQAVRTAYTEKVVALAAEFGRGVPDGPDGEHRALASIALCVGGLIISRAVNDEILADKISAACRRAVSEQLTGTSPASLQRPRRSSDR